MPTEVEFLKAAIQVRAAADGETRAGRLLMPETFSAHLAPELWVAIDPANRRILGAAAVAWQPLPPHAGFPVQIHVVPPARRRGIASALLGAVVDAVKGSTRHLHGWVNQSEGSAGAAFLAARGFEPRQRLLEFDADGARFYAMVKSIHDRLLASGRIPPDLKVISLHEASLDAVAALVTREFADVPIATTLAVAKGLTNYDMHKSAVLLKGGEVKGALLYLWNDGKPAIDVRVIAPELRRGPGNVLLLESATRKGLEGGAKGFRFHCDESVSDTISLARRSGATPAGVKLAFTRNLS